MANWNAPPIGEGRPRTEAISAERSSPEAGDRRAIHSTRREGGEAGGAAVTGRIWSLNRRPSRGAMRLVLYKVRRIPVSSGMCSRGPGSGRMRITGTGSAIWASI